MHTKAELQDLSEVGVPGGAGHATQSRQKYAGESQGEEDKGQASQASHRSTPTKCGPLSGSRFLISFPVGVGDCSVLLFFPAFTSVKDSSPHNNELRNVGVEQCRKIKANQSDSQIVRDSDRRM